MSRQLTASSLFINCTVEVGPLTFDPDVSFVNTPRSACGPGIFHLSFLEHGDVSLDPLHHCGMDDGDSALGHHFAHVAVARFISDVPSDRLGDE